jgi:hypothetical protein
VNASGVTLTRVVTITRGPETFIHQHTAIVRFIGFKREVPAPTELALVARRAIDDVFARQAPNVAITHLPETDADAAAVLASDCLTRRAEPLSPDCQDLFTGIRSKYGAEAVIVIDDWKARNLIGKFGSSGTGAGVYSRRNEGNALRAVIISHMGVHALVAGQPTSAVAPPCHNEGFIPRALDASKDPGQLDLAEQDWPEIDFRRTLSTAVYRALAPSGVLDINPRPCWDRDTEGSYYVPALI